MLYDAYQAQNDVFGPVRLMAETCRDWLDHPWLPIGDLPLVRSAAAAMELLSHAGMSHERPDFRHRSVISRRPRGRRSARRSSPPPVLQPAPFPQGYRRATSRRVLVVAPLSGHFATLLRGTVETLLPDHDVYLTDWVNARNVPLLHGRFGLDDFVDL